MVLTANSVQGMTAVQLTPRAADRVPLPGGALTLGAGSDGGRYTYAVVRSAASRTVKADPAPPATTPPH